MASTDTEVRSPQSRGGLAAAAALTPKQRSERARRGAEACNASLTPEERVERARRASAMMTPEERVDRARRAAEARWGTRKAS
jgi:hypothetical protein